MLPSSARFGCVSKIGILELNNIPPLPSTQESFGAQRIPRFGFSVEPAFPIPRLWFLDETGNRLVQVQSNRIVVNWRQLETRQDYPRYPVLRGDLIDALELLTAFSREENLGDVVPDQAELTYVNHFRAGEPGRQREPLSHFLKFWQEPTSPVLLDGPEEASLRTQYVMYKEDGPIGRLFIEVDSAYTTSRNEPLYVMNLVARGAPLQRGLDGALMFLDQAHVWIVQGFTDLTTPESHTRWERTR